MERIDGRPYSADDYNLNGDLYKNIFAEKVNSKLNFKTSFKFNSEF